MVPLVRTILTVFTAAVISAPVLVGQASAQSSRLDQVIKRDKLIVVTAGSAPPFSFTDEEGKLVGFDIDIAKLIAKDMLGDPEKIEFMTVPSEGRWPAVNSGRADFGIAGTTVYPDRAMRIAFSRPYLDSGISIMVRKDSSIKTIADLDSDKVTVVSLTNPQMADRQKRLFPKAKALSLDTPSSMFLAIKSGQAQAMQMDTPILDWYAANHGDMTVLPEAISSVQNDAIFMKPGDFAWWLYLDTYVQELRSGSRYADYVKIFKKWFGKEPTTPRQVSR